MKQGIVRPLTRRELLYGAGQIAVWGAGSAGLQLGMLARAAAAEAPADFKALVCVFLSGGNDHDNTVVPYDVDNHGKYLVAREQIAHPRTSLAATALSPQRALAGGRQYALHPALTATAQLFHQGRSAVLLNVGPLVQPTTREQYQSVDRSRYPLPAKLYSHNDQTSVWQSSRAEGAVLGWGGALGDQGLALNGDPLFTCMSLFGSSVFLSGATARQYQMNAGGPVAVQALRGNLYGSAGARDALQSLITRIPDGVLEAEYNKVTARSIGAEARLTSALNAVKLGTQFPGSALGTQMRTVARVIGARDTLGQKRQVFLVFLGGFDTHDGLIGRHASLVAQLDAALVAFYRATVELGVADKVTTFTASEFGRTLTHNGDGSDHGWGGHHLIMGDAVKGQAIYGTPPPVSTGNTSAPDDQWHTGQGRLIPSTSVEQYAATLGRWFGASDAALAASLPNLQNFGAAAGRPDYPVDLGFLAAA